MNPENFFTITGYPRIRTGWLSVLFTYGPSFCFHDGLQYRDFTHRMMKVASRPDIKHVGNSDCGYLFNPLSQLDHPRTILVMRSRKDAEESYIKHFSEHPYPQFGPPTTGEITTMFNIAERRMEHAANSGKAIVVKFEDLDYEDTVRGLWEKIVPDQPFCGLRWQQLDKLRVNPYSPKVRVEL